MSSITMSRLLLPLLLLIGGALQPAQAQLSQLKQAVEGAQPAQAAQAAAEKPEETRKRLEQWHQEARDMLARLNADDVATFIPAGITPAEVDARRRDLEQMVVTTTGFIKTLATAGDVRSALENARAADAAWTGFNEEPPYSILLLDELQNERDSIQTRLRSNQSSYDNLQGLLGSIVNETKAAGEAASSAMLAVHNAAAGQEDTAKWRLDAARAKARLLATRAAYLQASSENFKERVAATKAELSLIERKIAIVSANAVFKDEDIAKIEKIANDRRKSLEKEITAVSSRMRTAITARNRAKSALDAQQSKAAPTDGESDALTLARFAFDVADGRVESLQSVHEALEGLVHLENIGLTAYQDRRVLLGAEDAEKRSQALASLQALDDRLTTWLSVVNNERTACAAELSKIESRATVVAADDPRFELINEQRAAQSEKLAMLERVRQTVTLHRKLMHRWIEEQTAERSAPRLAERIGHLATATWQNIGKIWSWQVMSYEDRIEVDGQIISGKVPVTLGMLLRALLFFVVGYWIAARVANRIQHMVTSRGHIADAQAKTLRNWAMIVVGVALALGTLSFLKIPLTVFAFFGGALAIGLGFGMQTLIKNFISGIIVLAERKIRVGDILDVDGIIGTVVEVNTRSSIIRSADEVETMIPNSLFLENRVTNWTLSSSKMRRSVRVGVAYGTDPRLVIDILNECAGRHGLVCKDPQPFAVFEDFGDNALVFILYFWIDLAKGGSPIVIASDLRLMIEKRLAESGVSVPFPQRDIHLISNQPIPVRMTDE